MEERRLNWMQILVTAIVTGVVTIVTGIILFNLQTRAPNLVFEAADTSPFQGTDQNFAIYNVTISNRGGASISDVSGMIKVPLAVLGDSHVTADPSLKYTTKVLSDTLELQIPDLNPSETIGISIFATSKSDLPKTPTISIRGKGLTGTKASSLESTSIFGSNILFILVLALVSAYAGLTLAFVLRRGFGSKEQVRSGKHREDQNQVIAYLCGTQGLLDDVQEYLARPRVTSYWAESDRFAAIALANPKSEQADKRKRVLTQLLEYADVAPLSESIIHYNIARIAFAQGNIDEARTHIEKAKQKGAALIETRVKLESQLQQLV